jgi:hypothetical protein
LESGFSFLRASKRGAIGGVGVGRSVNGGGHGGNGGDEFLEYGAWGDRVLGGSRGRGFSKGSRGGGTTGTLGQAECEPLLKGADNGEAGVERAGCNLAIENEKGDVVGAVLRVDGNGSRGCPRSRKELHAGKVGTLEEGGPEQLEDALGFGTGGARVHIEVVGKGRRQVCSAEGRRVDAVP